MTKKDIAEKVALAFLGKPYIWGGDDPVQGFDCSGYVIEILKSAGVLPAKGDWTANQLWVLMRDQEVWDADRGCLLFVDRGDGRMEHVEYCLDWQFSIGASGGGSRTTSQALAIDQNAYIKIRPIRRAPSIVFANPFPVPVDDAK